LVFDIAVWNDWVWNISCRGESLDREKKLINVMFGDINELKPRINFFEKVTFGIIILNCLVITMYLSQI